MREDMQALLVDEVQIIDSLPAWRKDTIDGKS